MYFEQSYCLKPAKRSTVQLDEMESDERALHRSRNFVELRNEAGAHFIAEHQLSFVSF